MLRRTHVLGVSALLAVALGVGLTRAGAGPVADKEALSVPRRAVVIAAGDATLRDGAANQNQGAESLLRIRSSGRNRALVRFNATDLAEVLAGTTLVSAHLELKVKTNGGNWGAGQMVDAHRLTSSWSESAVTWNCPADTNLGNQAADCAAPWNGGTFAPAATASLLHTNALTGWVRFEVTADLEAAMAGAPFYGWLLKKTNEGTSGLVEYAAREVCGEEPRLVLELAAPAADTTPPRLTITSPAERFLVRQPASFNLSFFDAGAEIAPASLAVTLDGASLTATCSVCGATASCPAPLLAEGAHTLITSLRDTAGNLATARHEFDLLLGDGEHRVTLAAVADTHLRSGSPNQNEGADTLLRIRASGKNRALVRFDLAAIADLVDTLQSATLELTITTNGNNWGTGRTVDAHAVSAPWSELGATWNCASDTNPANSQPDCTPQWNGGTFASTATSSVTITNGLAGVVSFDVTADVVAALLSGEHHGWLLKKTFETQNGLVEFSSREGTAGPRLVLTFDGGEPVDATPPLLAITAPTAGEELETVLPSLAFAMSDDASGVNTASLAVVIDGAPVALSCAFTPSAATCSLAEPLADGPHTLTATIADHAGNTSSPASVTFSIDTRPPPDPSLPPDPATVAPPLDRTVVTDVSVATEFLYTGENPIQTGVAPGTIEPHRVAVIRGRVLDRDGLPLPGVVISVLDHPELGGTKSRADGAFDLAINGGGLVTLEYAKAGYLPLQRQVETPWKDYVPVEDVVMLPLDPEATTITAGASLLQVARGSAATDADGTRRATLLFPAGTTAVMELPDGSSVGLPSLTVRATEYTVGERGREAMPGPLPPTVAYTYAVELSADEAIATAAEKVTFSQPVSLYVENFLGFDVGSAVPVGFYDRTQATWIAADNGRVIKLLSLDANGRATLDLAGNGTAASAAELAALGITDAERLELARLYPAGQSLWRVAITHFTPYDCNWPYAPPEDAAQPPGDDDTPDEGKDDEEEPDCTDGSIIECQNQTLGERLELVGAPFQLVYASDRTPGRSAAYTVPVRVTGTTVPASLVRAEIEIAIAGRREKRSFPPTPNQIFTFAWDGKDAYGRRVQGAAELRVRKSYVYDLHYARGAAFQRAWARVGGVGFLDALRRQAIGGGLVLASERQRTLDIDARGTLGTFDAQALGLGGWMLHAHHVFDPVAEKLYLGSGTRRSARALGPGIYRSAGAGEFGYDGDGGPAELALLAHAADLAVAADGAIFIADRDNNVIRRIDRDGIITTVAGTSAACEWIDEETPPDCGEGVPATAALLNAPEGVAVNAAGELLIADTGDDCVRKVDAAGLITTLAGFCNGGGPPLKSRAAKALSGCDDCPATSAVLAAPRGLAPAPEGGVYIADSEHGRIRFLTPDGRLYTVAGGGEPADGLGDGGFATAASLVNPAGIALAPGGRLYIAEPGRNRIRLVSPAGRISTFAGTGDGSFCGDGGPAASACLFFPQDVAVSPDGSLLIADTGNHLLRRVGPGGTIETKAGTREPGGASTSEQGSAAETVELGPLGAVAVTRNDAILLGSGFEVLRLAATLRRETSTELLIPSPDGREVYVFDRAGRHQRTADALTGVTLLSFAYGAQGLVTEIRDLDGNVTTLNRTASGEVSEIVGPFGQATMLGYSAGLLASVTNPAGEVHAFTYSPEGLLRTMTDPRGGVRRYTYAGLGRLTAAEDPLSGTKTLARTNTFDGYQVSLTSPMGRLTRYQVSGEGNGSRTLIRSEPSGAASEERDERDGSRLTRSPDGSEATSNRRPDPRWRLAAPLPGTVEVKTPAGLISTVATSRGVALADPSNLLSVSTSLDRVTINGRTFTRAYDAATHTVTETSAEGRTRTTVLDAKGRPVTVAVPGIAPLEMSYDARGRLATVAQGSGLERRVMSFSYDAAGTLATVTDPLGRSASLTHDAAGRVTAMSLPGGRTVSLTYDANGNPTSLAPPGKPAHTFSFDGLDQVTSYQAPAVGSESSTTSNSYNLDRQPTEVTLPNGESLSFGYDPAGRLATATTPEGTYGFNYVPQTDKLATATAPGGVTLSTSYDGPLVTGATWSGPVVGAVAWTYNSDFRVRRELVNGAQAIDFAYDRDGALLEAGGVALTRDPSNGLLTAATAAGLATSWSRNSFGEISAQASALSGTPLLETTYQRDALGRIIQLTETLGGTTSTSEFSYDPAGRLASVERDGIVTATYSYDANGNRLAATDAFGTASASYDAQDRLVSYGGTSYTFDAAGDLTSKTQGSSTVSYVYDLMSTLRHVALPSGIEIDYLIDAAGRRVGKKVNGTRVQGFLYGDALRLAAELDGGNVVRSRFLYASRANVPDAMIKGGTLYAFVHDHLGSPRLVVNTETGTIAQRLDYDAFGRILLDTNPGFQPFGFAGGLYDPQTGLVRFGARDYDPEVGRWTTKDPIGFGGGDGNLYGYVWSDPVNLVDPVGLWGFGISLSETVELGLAFLGFGETGSLGAGIFARNDFTKPSTGAFASWGGFAGGAERGPRFPDPCPSDATRSLGAYAGAGAGLFFTNAEEVSDLSGPFRTFNVNAGAFTRGGSFQFSFTTDANGNLIFIGTYGGPYGIPTGVGFGAGISYYPTNTWTTDGH